MFGKNSRQQQPAASATLSKVQLLPLLPLPLTPCSPSAPSSGKAVSCFLPDLLPHPNGALSCCFAVGKFRCCSVSFYPDLSWKWNCCCAVVSPRHPLSLYKPIRNMCQWFLMPFKNIRAEVSAQFVLPLFPLWHVILFYSQSRGRNKNRGRERERGCGISPWLKSVWGATFF